MYPFNVMLDTIHYSDKQCLSRFHNLFFDRHFVYGKPMDIFWQGVPLQKNPMDIWVYQEMICELKPDVIIECGTGEGGSALFMAHVCDLMDHGRIVTIDIRKVNPLSHKRINFLTGSSDSGAILAQVKSLIKSTDSVMVFLDSDHGKEHVLREIKAYSPLVTKDNYLVVEDTHYNGHPVYEEHGPGPMEAVEEFLATHDDFQADERWEKFLFTFNHKGYLKKIK